jgi:hypothetical protein
MVASTATYPHEVVRSRMHIAGTGAFSGLATTCRQLLREGGASAFYRGCVTNLLRTTPAAAVTFTSFELISRQLREWAEEPEVSGGEAVRRQIAVAGGKGRGEGEEEDETATVTILPPFAAASSSAMQDPRRLETYVKGLDGGARQGR